MRDTPIHTYLLEIFDILDIIAIHTRVRRYYLRFSFTPAMRCSGRKRHAILGTPTYTHAYSSRQAEDDERQLAGVPAFPAAGTSYLI